MALPGTRRKDFALNYTSRVDGKPSSFWPTSKDSSSHHQQYSDFIRSHHYRNPFGLLTCTTCHDPHGNDENDSQLLIAAEDNTTCTQCHTDPFFPTVDEHVTEKTGFAHTGQELLCVTCHMVGTATSGAQSPQFLFDLGPPENRYFWGDIAGHRFEAQRKALACEQTMIPYTNACAQNCHTPPDPTDIPPFPCP
jgi:predicted CXXCH cytochrome family protein